MYNILATDVFIMIYDLIKWSLIGGAFLAAFALILKAIQIFKG